LVFGIINTVYIIVYKVSLRRNHRIEGWEGVNERSSQGPREQVMRGRKVLRKRVCRFSRGIKLGENVQMGLVLVDLTPLSPHIGAAVLAMREGGGS
jgi:hypothetical protein